MVVTEHAKADYWRKPKVPGVLCKSSLRAAPGCFFLQVADRVSVIQTLRVPLVLHSAVPGLARSRASLQGAPCCPSKRYIDVTTGFLEFR